MKALSIGLGLFILTCSAGAGTFVETFDDNGDFKKWQELTRFGLDAPGPWNIVDGELQYILDFDDGGLTRLLTTGDEMWQDYSIEFDVKPLRKHGEANIAIAARISQTWGVVCTIGDLPFPEPESMARCYGGNLLGHAFLNFAQEPHPSLKPSRWHHLKLSIHGNLLTFWINEKQVLGPIVLKAIGIFPDYPNGKVGFGVTNYSVLFDNITITGADIPNRGGLSITPRAKLATTWANLKQF